jgi:hypothetical protein
VKDDQFRQYMEAEWGGESLWPGWEVLQPMTDRDRLDYLSARFGRNAWPLLLRDIFLANQRLPDTDLNAVLAEAWCNTEYQQDVLGVPTWVQLFRRAGFVADAGQEPPSVSMTIYRGSTLERRDGMAWAGDLARARRFARRQSETRSAYVFRAEIEPLGVLAILDARDEAEVIIDPGALAALDGTVVEAHPHTPS